MVFVGLLILTAAFAWVATASVDSSSPLRDTVSDAFMSGLYAGCLTASAVCLAGALFVLAFLPAHPKKADPA